ncbi:hypothetical protein BCR34DRAFT_593794 [Clohesyomyces aquaticus]|uniref:Uncharacterized protein n=1 Tax=Clohesyomyces aquaticus TaxID=1231657 RepID=A0A1Y1YF17_9PLEO|nr:hypothetical protein BCR34DRAFT_593794 [Clohesyomyces aquaticus]
MATLYIRRVIVTPDFTTSNRADDVIAAGQPLVVFDPTQPPVPEGATGTESPYCCTLALRNSGGPRLPIQLDGAYPAIEGMKNGFRLALVWNNVEVFRTPTIPSPLKGPNFSVLAQQLDWAFSNRPAFPCRLGGQWLARLYNSDGVTLVAYSKQFLMELCFVWSGPPAGPVNPTTSGTLARPDFEGIYPVDLFRLFFPAPPDIPQGGTPLMPWYFQRVMRTIWGLGLAINPNTAATQHLAYEIEHGAPTYVDDYLGGQFELRRLIRTTFPTMNCYDLAALAQLAIVIFQDSGGAELALSRWIFCDNYGYINPGPLFGWPQYPNCNNPFFARPGVVPFYQEPPNNPDRRPFSNHAWVEVTPDPAFPLNRTVLDATHCLQNAPNDPAMGTQSRNVYLQAQTDQSRGNFTQRYGFRVPRRHATFETAATATGLINNASCDPETILTFVKQILQTATISDTDILVGSAGCQILTNINAVTPDQLSGPVHIEISNFEDEADARFTYSKRERILRRLIPAEGLLPIQEPLGDETIRTSTNITLRRNALLLRIFTSPQPGADIPATTDILLRLATLLDSHIATHAVNSGLEVRPKPVLRENPTISHVVGTAFTLHLNNLDNIGPILIAESDDHRVVLPAGPGTRDGAFKFFAIGVGKVGVRLCVAHREKLTAGVTVVEVEIVEGGDGGGDGDPNTQGAPAKTSHPSNVAASHPRSGRKLRSGLATEQQRGK